MSAAAQPGHHTNLLTASLRVAMDRLNRRTATPYRTEAFGRSGPVRRTASPDPFQARAEFHSTPRLIRWACLSSMASYRSSVVAVCSASLRSRGDRDYDRPLSPPSDKGEVIPVKDHSVDGGSQCTGPTLIAGPTGTGAKICDAAGARGCDGGVAMPAVGGVARLRS